MMDITNSGTDNKGGWCIIPSSKQTADTYRFTETQWTTFNTAYTLDPTTKVSPSSEDDEFFEVFSCAGEVYQITCYAFQMD